MAMNAGVPLLLVHEMIGLGQDARYPCEFGDFFRHGALPPEQNLECK